MFVTPNWSVNPTPATARMEAVTMPKPTAGTSVLTATAFADAVLLSALSLSLAERRDLRRRHMADLHDLAVHVPGGLEGPGGVVPEIEDNRAASADVLDLLACLERGLSLGEGVHDRLARSRLGDLQDVIIEHRRVGALGGEDRQRHHDDAVVVGHRVRVSAPLARLRHLGGRR